MSKREEIGTLLYARELPTINPFKIQTSQGFIDPNSSEFHRLFKPKAPSKSLGPPRPHFLQMEGPNSQAANGLTYW